MAGWMEAQRLKAGRRNQQLDHADDDIIGPVVFYFYSFPAGWLVKWRGIVSTAVLW